MSTTEATPPLPRWRQAFTMGHAAVFRAIAILAVAGASTHVVFDDSTVWTAAAHAIAGHYWALSAPLLALAIVARSGSRLAIAALYGALSLSWTLPGHLRSQASDEPRAIRVVTSNLFYINESPERLIDELIALNGDVMVVEELTPEWAQRLERHVGLEAWPHRHLAPLPGGFGIGLLSRRPLTIEEIDLEGVTALEAILQVDGRAMRLLGVHTIPPNSPPNTERWHGQMAMLSRLIDGTDLPTVVTGDLNATPFHPSYRRLLARSGLRDAHTEVGRGLATTWPNGLLYLPSIRLDHVLISDALGVTNVIEGLGPGSDHRPVAADLAWRDPGPVSVTHDLPGGS